MGFLPKERVNPAQQTFDKDRHLPDWDAKPAGLQAQEHAREQRRTARNLNSGRARKYKKE